MTAPVHQYSNEERRKRIFAIVGASSGNLVEWFDFYVYAFCAIYFAPAFFPSDNPTVQLLNTAGVFAAGFLMRPIGGWMFGRIADKHGRKTAMLISVVMMCAGSLAIACMPTYASIGTLAPALLLLARMFQGLSVGGEYGTSATYMSEVALKGQRGFFASFQYVTLIGGQLLAVLVVVILQQLLSEDELRAWGWRIPFVIGAITAVIALWLRRSLNETASKSTLERKESGTFAELFKHKRAFFTVLGFTAGGSLIFYTFTTYMQKYLVNTAGMSAKTASAVMTFALLAYMLMQPLFGMLSDRIGRKTSMLFRHPGHALHPADPARAEDREQSLHGLLPDHPGAGHRQPVHLHQRPDQGRDVPAGGARPRRRSVLRGGQRDLRRLGRVRRPGAEVGRDGERLLLVCFSHVPAGAAGLREPAGPAQGQLPERRALTGREKENR